MQLAVISHGRGEISDENFEVLKSNAYIAIHKDTSKSQAKSFQENLRKSDRVILYRSSSICGIGEIIGNVELGSIIGLSDDWLIRKYEPIKMLPEPKEIQILNHQGEKVRQSWSPHANRTFAIIADDRLQEVITEILPELDITWDEVLPEASKGLRKFLKFGELGMKKSCIEPCNKIFYGPPGTGKTYEIQDIAKKYVGEEVNEESDLPLKVNRYEIVTFHQSFSYEDFVEGIRAKTDEDGKIHYSVDDGIFKKICKKAKSDSNKRFALFIDEINRGNISNIFGELITLIEPDKREGCQNQLSVTLPYSQDSFSVPSNLDIYGTMNTSDHSLTLLDIALRRRFVFEELLPKPELLDQIKIYDTEIEELLTILNARIEVLLGRDYLIGHSYFLPLVELAVEEREGKLANIFRYQIIPLLQEYFFEDWERIQWVLNDQNKAKDDQFIHLPDNQQDLKKLFKFKGEEPPLIDRRYTINDQAFKRQAAYSQIINVDDKV